MPDIYTDPEILNSEVLPPVAPTRPMPPPFVAAPGTAFGYSTVGPSDFSSVQTGTMGGVPVMLPANAQNAFAVQGPVPTPESEFDKYWKQNYGNLPLEQAEQAIEAQNHYQGTRIYWDVLNRGGTHAEALQKAAPMLFYTRKGVPQAMAQMMKPPVTNRWVPPTGGAPGYLESTTGKVTIPKSEKPTFTPGDVTGQHLLDPDTKKPIPGFIAFPNATGTGMNVRTVKPPSELTFAEARAMLNDLPIIEGYEPGITAQLAPILIAKIKSAAPPPKTPAGYIVGKRYGNLRYKGGDPKVRSNWEEVK